MNWFLYDTDLRHERTNQFVPYVTSSYPHKDPEIMFSGVIEI